MEGDGAAPDKPGFLKRSRVFLGGLLTTAVVVLASSDACGLTEPQTIAVPSYFAPGPLWAQMEGALPTVSTAVVNPASGPGAAVDAAYADQIRRSRAAGLSVLGYVHTQYGARDPNAVKSDIDRYYEWYGVDGIFLDEASTSCGLAVSYYAPLRDHVKTKGGRAVTVVNPGVQTEECYMDAADKVVNFEGTYDAYNTDYSAPAWVERYPSTRFWHLIHSAPTARKMDRAVRLSKGRNAGWVYVTPDVMPNPWDVLPSGSYWKGELSAVRSGS